MNKQRRERLTKIYEELEGLIEEEQEAFDNLPESIQLSGRGEAFEENVSQMETARDALELILEN